MNLSPKDYMFRLSHVCSETKDEFVVVRAKTDYFCRVARKLILGEESKSTPPTFLCNVSSKDGEPSLTNLWIFFPNVWFEACDFLNSNNINLVRPQKIVSLNIIDECQELKLDSSSFAPLRVTFTLDDGRVHTMTASGSNRLMLKQVLAEFLTPRLLG